MNKILISGLLIGCIFIGYIAGMGILWRISPQIQGHWWMITTILGCTGFLGTIVTFNMFRKSRTIISSLVTKQDVAPKSIIFTLINYFLSGITLALVMSTISGIIGILLYH